MNKKEMRATLKNYLDVTLEAMYETKYERRYQELLNMIRGSIETAGALGVITYDEHDILWDLYRIPAMTNKKNPLEK